MNKKYFWGICGRGMSFAIALSMVMGSITGCGSKKVDESADSVEEISAGEEATSEVSLLPEENNDGGEATEATNVPFETQITVVHHYLSCRSDDKEIANGRYPEFVIKDEFAAKYPALCEVLRGMNDSWKEDVTREVQAYGHYKLVDNFAPDEPYTYSRIVGVIRADDKLFTVEENYEDYSGGAHPNHGTTYYNYDPATGKIIPLKDVITVEPGQEQSQMFWQRLYDTYPDMVEEFKSYDFGTDESGKEVDTFADKLEQDTFSWCILPGGLSIKFSPYEVASYAAGDLMMTFSDIDSPGLVKPEYMTTEYISDSNLVSYSDAYLEKVTPKEPGMDGSVSISNPTWNSFYDTSYRKENPEYVTLEKITEEKSDWLNLDDWYMLNDIARPQLSGADLNYRYEAYEPVEYDYMYTKLKISDVSSMDELYNFDLYELANGPDADEGKYTLVTEYITWARVYENMLYVELSIAGYASEEPNSSYIVAIDLDTRQVVFRTEPQTANAYTFEVVKDTIICGYGFTSEPDYLYILDRFTGERIEQIPVNSAPYHIEEADGILYVACYNTAYEFKILDK